MKRIILVLSLVLSMFLVACGSDAKQETTSVSESSKIEKEETVNEEVKEVAEKEAANTSLSDIEVTYLYYGVLSIDYTMGVDGEPSKTTPTNTFALGIKCKDVDTLNQYISSAIELNDTLGESYITVFTEDSQYEVDLFMHGKDTTPVPMFRSPGENDFSYETPDWYVENSSDEVKNDIQLLLEQAKSGKTISATEEPPTKDEDIEVPFDCKVVIDNETGTDYYVLMGTMKDLNQLNAYVTASLNLGDIYPNSIFTYSLESGEQILVSFNNGESSILSTNGDGVSDAQLPSWYEETTDESAISTIEYAMSKANKTDWITIK